MKVQGIVSKVRRMRRMELSKIGNDEQYEGSKTRLNKGNRKQ